MAFQLGGKKAMPSQACHMHTGLLYYCVIALLRYCVIADVIHHIHESSELHTLAHF